MPGRIAGVICSVFFEVSECRVRLLGSNDRCFFEVSDSAGSDCWGQVFGAFFEVWDWRGEGGDRGFSEVWDCGSEWKRRNVVDIPKKMS